MAFSECVSVFLKNINNSQHHHTICHIAVYFPSGYFGYEWSCGEDVACLYRVISDIFPVKFLFKTIPAFIPVFLASE